MEVKSHHHVMSSSWYEDTLWEVRAYHQLNQMILFPKFPVNNNEIFQEKLYHDLERWVNTIKTFNE